MYYSVYMYKLKIFCISSAQNAKRTISYMASLYPLNNKTCLYCIEIFIHRFIP